MLDITNAINELERSPLHRMSLGSRELFHSNFLAWLFENFPSAIQACFGKEIAYPKIYREKNQLDLLIYDGDTPTIVIENKVKDYPNYEQLARYGGRPQIASANKYLLTLVKPTFELPKGWELKTYSDLHDALKSWSEIAPSANDADAFSRHRSYITDYIEMIGNLAHIANQCFDYDNIENSKFWFEKSYEDELDQIGFKQTYQKFQAAALEIKIREFLEEQLPDTAQVTSWSTIFRNTPCVTFEVPTASPTGDEWRLEIQIQGNAYRRLIMGQPIEEMLQENPKNRDEKMEEAIREAGFGDWLLDDLKSPKMRKTFCTYKPNAAYQYLHIDESGTT